MALGSTDPDSGWQLCGLATANPVRLQERHVEATRTRADRAHVVACHHGDGGDRVCGFALELEVDHFTAIERLVQIEHLVMARRERDVDATDERRRARRFDADLLEATLVRADR